MQIEQRSWPISQLYRDRNAINLNPRFQRGSAWKSPRQVLLIDSILRGMDIPKIYLRRLAAGGPFEHDAVDGQQRLRAIWEFRDGVFPLRYTEPLPPIDGHNVADLRFDELHRSLRNRFNNFVVSVGEIMSSTSDEISSLFSRLQMGVSLNPAELRNALGGPMLLVIDSIAGSHDFFLESRISDARYKRQDYTTLLFAVAAYRGRRNIKAPDLKVMLGEYGPDRTNEILEISAEVGDALNVLAQVNALLNHRLTQKWIVIDLAWLIMQRQRRGWTTDPERLAAAYELFDERRREYNNRPEDLLRGRRRDPVLNRHLYNYINAFKLQGGVAENLEIRADTLRAFFPNIGSRA